MRKIKLVTLNYRALNYRRKEMKAGILVKRSLDNLGVVQIN